MADINKLTKVIERIVEKHKKDMHVKGDIKINNSQKPNE